MLLPAPAKGHHTVWVHGPSCPPRAVRYAVDGERLVCFGQRGWGDLNSLEPFGAFVVAGVIIFLINFVVGMRSPKTAPDDPWEASTLEWYTTAPPLVHNVDLVPEVPSARSLCDLRRAQRAAAKE